MKTAKQKVGEAVYDSWPTGATKAIELLELEKSTIRSLIEDAITETKVRRDKYLNAAIELIDGKREMVAGRRFQGIIPKNLKRKERNKRKKQKKETNGKSSS